MSRRVLWLFMWTTLAFWAGCSQSRQAADAELEAGAAEYRTHVRGEASLDPVAPGVAEAAPAAAADADAVDPVAASAGVSVVALDRKNWSSVSVSPVSGQVPHHPQYFRTGKYRLTEDRPNPLADATIEQQADAVTANARAPFDKTVAADTALAAGKAAFDLLAVPVKVIMTPPTTIHYSPSTRP